MDYQVSVVQRTPQQLTVPTLVEVGPILDPSELSWSEELNRGGAASVTCDPRILSSAIKTKILEQVDDDSDTPGLELWIHKDSIRVFEGPIVGYRVQGEANTLTINARGLLDSLRGMWLIADHVVTDDQYDIGKHLVDQWQAENYHHFGIDTSGIGASGTNRTVAWLAHEQHNVFQRLTELAEVDGGFDFYITTTARDLVFAAAKGSNKSATVILDERGVEDPGISVSFASGVFASKVFASSSGSTLLTATATDTTLLQSFGAWGHAATFETSVQADLDAFATRALEERDRPMFVPAPSVIPVSGSSVTAFDAGDTIEFSYDFGVGTVTVQRRVVKKEVKVGEEGQEQLGVVFE